MRVLVCGGRDYYDFHRIELELDVLHGLKIVTLVIQGEASGADKISKQWAKYRGIPTAEFPAIWRMKGEYNPNAGPERN